MLHFPSIWYPRVSVSETDRFHCVTLGSFSLTSYDVHSNARSCIIKARQFIPWKEVKIMRCPGGFYNNLNMSCKKIIRIFYPNWFVMYYLIKEMWTACQSGSSSFTLIRWCPNVYKTVSILRFSSTYIEYFEVQIIPAIPQKVRAKSRLLTFSAVGKRFFRNNILILFNENLKIFFRKSCYIKFRH